MKNNVTAYWKEPAQKFVILWWICYVYDKLGYECLNIMKCVTIIKMNLKNAVRTGILEMCIEA